MVKVKEVGVQEVGVEVKEVVMRVKEQGQLLERLGEATERQMMEEEDVSVHIIHGCY